MDNNIQIKLIYSEISNSLDLDRPQFTKLLDDIFDYKIRYIYISNKYILTHNSFKTLESICKQFNVRIILINENHSTSNDN